MLTIPWFDDPDGKTWYPVKTDYDAAIATAKTLWRRDIGPGISDQMLVESDMIGEYHWVTCRHCGKQVVRSVGLDALLSAHTRPVLVDPNDDDAAREYELWSSEKAAVLAAQSLGFVYSNNQAECAECWKRSQETL